MALGRMEKNANMTLTTEDDLMEKNCERGKRKCSAGRTRTQRDSAFSGATLVKYKIRLATYIQHEFYLHIKGLQNRYVGSMAECYRPNYNLYSQLD